MGKKISIDSATMMNKIFEIIEAQKIFEIEYNKFSMMIHPHSYLHAIIRLNNGLIKFLAHDTSMKIPIFNSIFNNLNMSLNTNKINYHSLNNLELSKISTTRYPSIKILKNLKDKPSLYDTAIVSVNDELVKLFIDKKIKFNDISKNLLKILNLKEFLEFRTKFPKNYKQIKNHSVYVRLKTRALCI